MTSATACIASRSVATYTEPSSGVAGISSPSDAVTAAIAFASGASTFLNASGSEAAPSTAISPAGLSGTASTAPITSAAAGTTEASGAVGGVAVLLGAIILEVVLGNLLVVVSVCRERRLRTVANLFIVNLALADLLIGVAVMPFALSQFALGGRWIYGGVWCDLWRSLDVLGCTASILNLCAIATHKYWAIREPIAYPRAASTRRRAGLSAGLIWLTGSVAAFPAIAWWSASDGPMPEQRCTFTTDRAYVIISSLLSFYAPSAIMLAVYARIYSAANNSLRSLTAGTVLVGCVTSSGGTVAGGADALVQLRIHKGNNHVAASGAGTARSSDSSLYRRALALGREKKAARTLGIVIGVFLLCWTPFFTCQLINALCGRAYIDDATLLDAITWLGYVNSGANPIIYALSMKDFRRAFVRTLGRGYLSAKRHSKRWYMAARGMPYFRPPTSSVRIP